MKASSSGQDEQDREIIRLLEELGSFKSTYPLELLTPRREAFVAQLERLSPVAAGEADSAEDREVVKLLETLGSARVEYPSDLLAARRSAFLRQMERAAAGNVWDRFRVSIQDLFQVNKTASSVPVLGFLRISLVLGTLAAAVWIGSLFLTHGEEFFRPAPLGAATTLTPTQPLPTNPGKVAILVCNPASPTPSCPRRELGPRQDLANLQNGSARPAVAKDAYQAASYVNDGRRDVSWVSKSPDSWIKLDLGQVRTINTVSLEPGNVGASMQAEPGQFVIAVALTDVYSDGDSSNDYAEYTQVFYSKQTGFSGDVSSSETIQAQFPSVKARFVKITFEKAGAAIEEVGVFMLQPPELGQLPTTTPQDEYAGITPPPDSTGTGSILHTATAIPSSIWVSTDTAVPNLTNTPSPADTLTPLPTGIFPPAETSTPLLVNPSLSETPIPPIVPPSPPTTGTFRVTGNDQTVTFTCDGDAVEIRGHSNTVTLRGPCSSITVTGNGNSVFWESGSPVITNGGTDNIIRQL